MPIYEYRCEACGFQDEHLQKVSEPPMTVCPSCGKATYRKQLSAAGFQLKGSGWYATDFKGSGKPAQAKAEGKADGSPEAKGDAKSEAKPDAKPDAKAKDSPKSAAAPASTTTASDN
jgi:putative FmdB family regulatory protein